MKLSDFRYTAPKSITAKFPHEPRDESKLLVLDRKTGDVEDRVFTDIVDFFKKGDCLVVNESRVFPARQQRDGDPEKLMQLLTYNPSGL